MWLVINGAFSNKNSKFLSTKTSINAEGFNITEKGDKILYASQDGIRTDFNTKYLFKSGADIIDVGGESTRPGSKIISTYEEWKRIKVIIKNFQS